MLRGDVHLIDLDPARGSEADKRRPAVIVSNDGANVSVARRRRGVVTVVPLTSNTARVYPFQVLLSAEECGLAVDSKAQAEQVRSVDIRRVGSEIGRVPEHLLSDIGAALRLHLDL